MESNDSHRSDLRALKEAITDLTSLYNARSQSDNVLELMEAGE